MRRVIAIFLLLSLLLTPAYAVEGISEEILAWAELPPQVPVFTHTGATFYTLDGNESDEQPRGDATPHYNAAGDVWIEVYENGYVLHDYAVSLVDQSTPAVKWVYAESEDSFLRKEPATDQALVEITWGQGETFRRTTYEYDNAGRRLSYRFADRHGKLFSTNFYSYPAEHIVCEEQYDKRDKWKATITTHYNDAGRAIYVHSRYADPDQHPIVEQYFNDAGEPMRSIGSDEDGTVLSRTEYLDSPAMKGSISYDADGEITSFDVSSYDIEGKLIKEESLHEEGSYSVTRYHYNADGALTDSEKFYDGVLSQRTSYTDFGEPLREERFNEDGRLWSHEDTIYKDEQRYLRLTYRDGALSSLHRYDDAGNLIRSLSLRDGELRNWTEFIHDNAGRTDGWFDIRDGALYQLVLTKHMDDGELEMVYSGKTGEFIYRGHRHDINGNILYYFNFRTDGQSCSYDPHELIYAPVSSMPTARSYGPYHSIGNHITWQGETILVRSEYDYNTDGMVAVRYDYDQSGALLQRTDSVYGAYENILWVQTMAADGTILERIDYFYDANGVLIATK